MKRFWKIFGRAALILATVLLVLAVTVLLGVKMICGSTSGSARQMFATTLLETGQLKFLVNWFLSGDEIRELVDGNSMEEFSGSVDPSLIVISSDVSSGQSSSSSQGGVSTDPAGHGGEEEDISVITIAGRTFTGTLMIVRDPSRVSLATIYPWREIGVTLDKLVKSAGAVAGVNGGLYRSTNNTGGSPLGVVVSDGKILYNKPKDLRGLVLIGLTEDNILQIIDISGMTPAQLEDTVREKKIRDATVFQEESSDKNNHFVWLVVNGEARKLNGMGSGLNPRTAIGQRADGALLLLVTDGRGTSGHLGASASDLIDIMLAYGAVNAANLDGGSSTCMYYDGAYLQTSVTFYYANSSWYLPFAFVVK